MTANSDWKFAYVLNNISLAKPFEAELIAIVPHSDYRVKEIVRHAPTIGPLVRRFTDQPGRRTRSSALIVHADAPASVWSDEAVVGFRNVFAITCLIQAWQRTLKSGFCMHPLHTDSFDLYPITPTKDGTYMLTSTPAVSSVDLPRLFRGQVSPGLPNPNHISAVPDAMLAEFLSKAWRRRYARKTSGGWRTRVLFRSLEMAYQAGSIPTANRSRMYDYGSRIALWVSAFEVLTHPRRGEANLETVLALLDKAKWRHSRLRQRRWVIKLRGNTRRVSLIQKLYRELYDARNDFLHGNPVTPRRLHPFRRSKSPLLTHLAPLLYKVALICFLSGIYPPPRGRGLNFWRDVFDRGNFEEALLTSLEGVSS